MSIENNVSRVTLGRDIKLRKLAIILFILVSFLSLISLLWATDISLNLPFLYAIYIIVTLYVLRFAKVDIFSPLMFFIFFSFLGFGLQLPILSIVPNSVFFINPFYHPNFEYSNYALAFAFFVFLIGYIGFIVGFNMVKRSVKLTVSERLVHPLGIDIVAVILILASFYFRSRYNVGVPGYYAGSIKHAGYLYYPLMYGSLIATSLTLYSAIIRNSVFYTILGVLLFCLYALLGAVLGWKGDFILAIIIILMIYYYVDRYRLQNISKDIRHLITIMMVVLFILFVLFYSVIGYYRTVLLINQSQTDITSFVSILNKNINAVMSSFSETLNAVQNRISYLSNLVAITTYFQQNLKRDFEIPSFFLNLLNIGIYPEEYYTWYILGVSPNIITTNAPTGWGALYIYGGVLGVLIGMILFGMLSKFLYLTFIANIYRDGRWIIFYAIFMDKIFLPVVFEGTIINYFKKNFVALLFVYAFFIFMLNIVHPIKYSKKLFEEGKP